VGECHSPEGAEKWGEGLRRYQFKKARLQGQWEEGFYKARFVQTTKKGVGKRG